MIRVEGLSLEKFLNLAAEQGVVIVNARRMSYTVLNAVVSARGFKKLQSAATERYSINLQKQAGVPYQFSRLILRKVLFVGLALITAGVFAASLFVWEVKINGLGYNEAAALKEELVALGIYGGALKSVIDVKEAEKRLMIDHPDYAWINVRLRGAVASVEVVPAIPVPEIVDDTRPCNIVAAKDALIESVTARTGRACVEKGDTVREGDMLISGLVWDPGMARMLFVARGEVIGSVWYSGAASAPLYRKTRSKTGRSQTQRVIAIGADTAVVDGECSFAEYQTAVVGASYIAGLFLPVKLMVLEHSEVVTEYVPAELQGLRVYLEERAYYEAAGKTEANIVSHVTVFSHNENVLTATAYVQTFEDIGKVVYLEE